MAINLNKKVYKVFDSEGNYLRTFPSYQQAMTFVQSRGGIGKMENYVIQAKSCQEVEENILS